MYEVYNTLRRMIVPHRYNAAGYYAASGRSIRMIGRLRRPECGLKSRRPDKPPEAAYHNIKPTSSFFVSGNLVNKSYVIKHLALLLKSFFSACIVFLFLPDAKQGCIYMNLMLVFPRVFFPLSSAFVFFSLRLCGS